MGTRVRTAAKSLTAPWGGDLALASGAASPALGHFVPCHRRLFHIWGRGRRPLERQELHFPVRRPFSVPPGGRDGAKGNK